MQITHSNLFIVYKLIISLVASLRLLSTQLFKGGKDEDRRLETGVKKIKQHLKPNEINVSS